EACMGDDFMAATWPDVATAVHVSTYSLKALTELARPLFAAAGGGSVVGLDFDATVAWPEYGWMGVAKAGLESCARYLARALGRAGGRAGPFGPCGRRCSSLQREPPTSTTGCGAAA